MFLIGITGLSCSGKTSLSEKLLEYLGKDNCILMSMDDYYNDLTEEQYKILYNVEASVNFDEPSAVNFDLLKKHLDDILNNRPISIPKFNLGSYSPDFHFQVEPNKYRYIILEGVFIFCDEQLKNMCNLKIWVDTGDYVCALRRFIKYTRDVKGYGPELIYNQCLKHVIPGQEKYIKPCKLDCDVIYNGEKDDKNQIEMIAYLIRQKK